MDNLLIRPIPQKKESPLSILFRAAEANGWKNISKFLLGSKILDYSMLPGNVVTNEKKWPLVIESLGLIRQLLSFQYISIKVKNRQCWVNFNGILVCRNDLRLTYSHICSKCLLEDGVAYGYWDHNAINLCFRHQVRLLTRCPKCFEKISWNRPILTKCGCGYSFNENDSKKASEDISKFIENIFLVQDQEKLNSHLQLINIFHEFFEFIGIDKSDYELSYYAYLLTEKFILLKRKIFDDVLAAINSKGIHPRLSLVPFITANSNKLTALANSTLESVCKKIIVDKSYNFNRNLGIKEAVYALGLSYRLTKKLIEHNLIKTKMKLDGGRWQIDAASVNQLLIKLTKGKGKIRNGISLKYLIYSPGLFCNFVDSIKLITRGNVSFEPMTVTQGILSVEIEKAIKEKNENLLKISEVAELCNVCYENIRFAIHAGILKRVNSNPSKRGTIFIEKNEAYRFNRTFVFAGVLAKEHKLNHTNLSEKIKAQGISPVSGPNIDGGLTYLFKRSDIRKINFRQLTSLDNYPTKTGRKKEDSKKAKDIHSVSIEFIKDKLKISNSKIIGLIEKGFLKRQSNNVREVRITKSSFDKLCKKLFSTQIVDIEQALKITHESKTAFYKRWIDTGYVQLIDLGLGKFISKVDFKKIQAFKGRYITCQEAASITNTNRTYLPNLEKLGKIKKARSLFNGSRPIKFYLRAEALDLIQKLKKENEND